MLLIFRLKAPSFSFKVLDIVFDMEHKTSLLSSSLCVTHHLTAIVCSRIPAVFKTPAVSNHGLVSITAFLVS